MAMKCFNHKNTRKERNIHNFLELFALGVKGKNNGFGVMLCHYYLQNWILQHTTILSYKSFMSQLDFKDFLPFCTCISKYWDFSKIRHFFLMKCWHMTRAFIAKKTLFEMKSQKSVWVFSYSINIANFEWSISQDIFFKLKLIISEEWWFNVIGVIFSLFLWGIFIIYYFLFYRYARWFSNFTQRHRCFCWTRHNIKMFPAKRTSKSRSSVEKRWRFLGSNLF